MKTNWTKLLVVCLLVGLAGFFLGRWCAGSCGNKGAACHRPMACCDKDGNCEHGGTCCKPGGQCTKADCDHAAMMEGHGKACCKGGHHGHHAHHGGTGAEAAVEDIVLRLKEGDFEGDTTIAINGGTVNVIRNGERMEVRVNVADSLKNEEVVVDRES